MIQELKKDIKAVMLSEYKLMACILVVLIIFWKFINKLISTYIVCITETVTNDSLFIALIFFLCPVFIALIKRDYLKRETKKFSQRHLWEFFLFVVYVGFKIWGRFDFYSYMGFSYFAWFLGGMFCTECILFLLYKKDSQGPISRDIKSHPFSIDAPTTNDGYNRDFLLRTLLDKVLSTFDSHYFVENPQLLYYFA